MKVSQQGPKLMMLSRTSLIMLLTLVFFFSFTFFIPSARALNIGLSNTDNSNPTLAINIPNPFCQDCLACNFSSTNVNNSMYWAGYTPTTYYVSYIWPYLLWNATGNNIYQYDLFDRVGIGTKTPEGLLEVKDSTTTNVIISSGVGNENATLQFRESDVPRASIEYVGLTGLLNFWSKYADGDLGVMLSMNTRTDKVTVTKNLSVGEDVYIMDDFVVDGNVSMKRPYGMYSSTEDQTIAVANTAYPVTFNWTEDDYLYLKSSDNANFTALISGDYMITLSAIVVTTTNNKHVEIWTQIEGVDVPRSNTKLEIENAGTEQIISVPFIIDLNAGEEFRIMWASDGDGTKMEYTTNTSYSPASPSIIMTIGKLSEITD